MAERDLTNLSFAEMTWGQRALAALGLIVGGILGLALFIGFFMLLAQIVDVQSERISEHNRCMKHATNGYDIERCR